MSRPMQSHIPGEDPGANIKAILGLTLVHFTGDFYASFINPLIPVFADKFSLNLVQVGLITGIGRLLEFLVQPSVGYLADRYRSRILLYCGLIMAIVFFPLTGVATGFAMLLLFIALGSAGSSMFHPSSAGMIPTHAGGHLGLSASIFNMGGTLAFSIGPLFITAYVGRYHLGAAPWTMVIGFCFLILLLRILPSQAGGEMIQKGGFVSNIREALGGVWRPIALLWVVTVLRFFVGQSFFTFLPVLYAREGYSLVSIGTIVSLFTIGGTLSGVIAGHLSDRFGYKRLFYATHALTTPALFLLILSRGQWVYFGAFLTGFFILASVPLGLAMAQRLAPKGSSMVASFMMGAAFGSAGLMTPLTGKLMELFSIRDVLGLLALVPLSTVALIYFFPQVKPAGQDPSDGSR